jgi:tRNA(Ile)-lysidine synthase TilS/MesJ
MLESGDNLLVGLSGGKDSYILLETLANRKKASPFSFEMSAVHVKVQNLDYQVDLEYMKTFCEDLGVPLALREIEVDFKWDPKKAPCYVCSWHRRKEIFNFGKVIKCNKLAFGHHRDDALETLLMNMIYHGSVSSLPYTLRMFNGRVRLIRPLMDIWEKDLEEYSGYRNFSRGIKTCPYDDKTKRQAARLLIESMDKSYIKAKMNIFRSMNNIYPEYLPGSSKGKMSPEDSD